MPHVLVIDDDPVIGELLANVLSEDGHTYELVTSLDGVLPGRPPAVIVTDLVGLTEFQKEAAREYVGRVRGEFREARVVVCTAHRDADGVDLGADAIITKPFDIETMLSTVARLAECHG